MRRKVEEAERRAQLAESQVRDKRQPEDMQVASKTGRQTDITAFDAQSGSDNPWA